MLKFQRLISHTSSRFKGINFKSLDSLLRDRMFELVTPRMKYFLRDHVRGDLKVVKCNRLNIGKCSFEINKTFSHSSDTDRYDFADNKGLSEEEIFNVNGHLQIYPAEPGIVSRLSGYILFNHNKLAISSSILTESEFKLLFTKRELINLTVHHLKIVDDHSNQLSKKEKFELMLKALIANSNELKLVFDFSGLPPNWLQMLHESDLQFATMVINMEFQKEGMIPVDSKSLHKFIAAQEKHFRLYIYVRRFFSMSFIPPNPDDFDHEFSNYFKKTDGKFRNNYFVLETYLQEHKNVYFELK